MQRRAPKAVTKQFSLESRPIYRAEQGPQPRSIESKTDHTSAGVDEMAEA